MPEGERPVVEQDNFGLLHIADVMKHTSQPLELDRGGRHVHRHSNTVRVRWGELVRLGVSGVPTGTEITESLGPAVEVLHRVLRAEAM